MSPFLFSEIIGGSWYMWISYAFAPLYAQSFIELTSVKLSLKKLIIFLISLISVISSLQNFVLLELILLIYLVLTFRQQPQLKQIIYRYIILHIWIITINLYWILPLLTTFNQFSTATTSESFTGNFAQVKQANQTIRSIMDLTGYLNRNMYWFALPTWGQFGLIIASSITWITTIYTLYSRKANKKIYIWILILMILVVIIKGNTPPLGQFTMWIFRNFPLMSLYRSPQHLMFAPAFILPIIFSFISHHLPNHSSLPNKKYLTLIPWIIILLWTSAWWLNGDLGHNRLLSQNKDRVNYYSLPSELINTYNLSETDQQPHRILFLPTSFSPDFLDTPYQTKGQGGQPEYMYLSNPTLTGEHTPIANLIEDNFCYQSNSNNWIQLLQRTSVKYIALRKDIRPKFTSCAKSWNQDHTSQILTNSPDLSLISQGEYVDLYQLDNDLFQPLISAPRDIQIVTPESSISANLIYPNTINQPKFDLTTINNTLKIESPPQVQFQKLNPTRYSVSLSNMTSPFILFFNQNFNSKWQLISPGHSKLSSIINLIYPPKKSLINNNQHLIANGYANAWFVDPESICQLTICTQTNNKLDTQIIIEFWPQKTFYLSLILSSIFTTTGIFLLPRIK